MQEQGGQSLSLERRAAFRSALGSFATGVTVVTARSPEGRLAGVTASSFNSVSLDPPFVLWSLAKSSRSRVIFESSAHFIVNVLAFDQTDLSSRFASRELADKFDGLSFESGVGGAPVLPQCAATFQCEKAFVYEGGDHWIFVGKVLDFSHRECEPLVFHGGQYAVARPHPGSQSNRAAHRSNFFVDDYLPSLLSTASEAFAAGFSNILANYGVTNTQWRILYTLADHRDGLTSGELSAINLIATDSVESALDGLAYKIWVRRERESDGQYRYRLTDDGWLEAVPLLAAAQAHEDDTLGGLPAEETRRLKETLKSVIASLKAHM